MIRGPTRSTRNDTLLPYTALFLSIISAGTVAAIAEALTLAESAGVTVEQFPAALVGGWADSPLLRHYAPRMIAGEFQGSTRTMLHDLEKIGTAACRESVCQYV